MSPKFLSWYFTNLGNNFTCAGTTDTITILLTSLGHKQGEEIKFHYSLPTLSLLLSFSNPMLSHLTSQPQAEKIFASLLVEIQHLSPPPKFNTMRLKSFQNHALPSIPLLIHTIKALVHPYIDISYSTLISSPTSFVIHLRALSFINGTQNKQW